MVLPAPDEQRWQLPAPLGPADPSAEAQGLPQELQAML